VSHGREMSSLGGKVGDGRGGRQGRGNDDVMSREAVMTRHRR
jgi:hypothetical protein